MNRENALSGYVAIALAILFPVYWGTAFWYGLDTPSLAESFRADITRLSLLDGLFLLIGVMEIYLYLSLRRVLQNHLEGRVCTVLLVLMAIAVGLQAATVLFDLVLGIGGGLVDNGRDWLVMMASTWLLLSMFAIGVIGLVLSIALLVTSAGGAPLLKVFAVVLMISSLLTLSIMLAPLSFVTYPIAFLVLGVFFLRGGYEVEVV